MVCAGAAMGSERGAVVFTDRIMGAKVSAVRFGDIGCSWRMKMGKADKEEKLTTTMLGMPAYRAGE